MVQLLAIIFTYVVPLDQWLPVCAGSCTCDKAWSSATPAPGVLLGRSSVLEDGSFACPMARANDEWERIFMQTN